MTPNSGQWAVGSGQWEKDGPVRGLAVHRPLPTFHRRRGRPGFTLLELLLATVIGSMILAGLYVVMNVTVNQTQASRDAADVEGLSRAVFNKVGVDLSNVLGPGPPKSGGKPESGSTAGITSDSGGAPTPETPAEPPATEPAPAEQPADEAATTDPAAAEATQGAANIPFQVGVLGTRTQLSVFASRVPDALAVPGDLNRPADPTSARQRPADLVRVDYWKGAGGLCRQERPWVTAQQTGSQFSFDLSAEAASVIAEEVGDVAFEYHDGSGWVETWEGGGGAVPAPPRAVRVTLTFSAPGARGGEPVTRTVSQVIAVRTAPGDVIPELTDPVAPPSGETPAQDTGGASGGGSGGGSGGTSSTSKSSGGGGGR